MASRRENFSIGLVCPPSALDYHPPPTANARDLMVDLRHSQLAVPPDPASPVLDPPTEFPVAGPWPLIAVFTTNILR